VGEGTAEGKVKPLPWIPHLEVEEVRGQMQEGNRRLGENEGL
jgi:hypothetical protein